MNKYNVYLTEKYNKKGPFIVDWDCELIGDKLRNEFEVYFKEQEEIAGAGAGRTKQLFKGDYVKKFMVHKRINLVDDPVTQNLKSVFILRKGEKKLIDQRAKDNLASRFEYRVKKNQDGVTVSENGFLKFELVEGTETKEVNPEENVSVGGEDLNYFGEEEKEPTVEDKLEKLEKEAELVACEVCGKEFKSKRALNAHGLSHRKEKDGK